MKPSSHQFSHWLALGAGAWLLLGGFLLALTPLPAHTEQLGWSPTFWLFCAPLCVLLALPLRSAARWESRAYG